ncbi:uncharacterized protein [Henckelia pumila]|uniref:uncharacterized protein n=1 Tax=Henckelia pumila TaxID=405737 RepID=UPI003C6E4E08
MLLCAHFQADDVRKALFDMHPDKAQARDGMSIFFFQNFWDVIGEEVTVAVLKLLNEGTNLSDWKRVNEFESAFTSNRLISDNIILGFEALHWIRSIKKGQKGYTTLKLDMSTLYDKVEWNFLEGIMLRLGFSLEWVEKIMRCVCTVRYSFSLNDS